MESTIIKPRTGEILIKVAIAGTDPKDWKGPDWSGKTSNPGDDVAGFVAGLGAGVLGLSVGQRVAAMHAMWTPSATFVVYALTPQHLTFPIPDSVSFAETATIPLAAYTSAVALFHSLELPAPWDLTGLRVTQNKQHPLIIYGASSALGAFGIKLAKAANIHPIIAVGSKNNEFIRRLLQPELGDIFVDYTTHPTDTEPLGALKSAIKGSGAERIVIHTYDCVWEPRTAALLSKAIARDPDASGSRPRVTIGFEDLDSTRVDSRVQLVSADVSLVQEQTRGGKLFGLIWGQTFARGLADGWLTSRPYEIVGALEQLSSALKGLRDGTIRDRKALIRIDRSF